MLGKMKYIVFLIFVMLLLFPQYSSAKEIYEEEGISITGSSVIEGGDDIFVAKDMTVPNERISSIDVNKRGELLVCFRSKIIIFDNQFKPVKAFDIWWGRGSRPSVVWNDKTDRIVYMRGISGYELDDQGNVIYYYADIGERKFEQTEIEWNGTKYELENRMPLRNPSHTYSTLIMTDENEKETVLHNALLSQFLAVLPAHVIPPVVIVGLIVLVTREKKRARRSEEEKAEENRLRDEELKKELEAQKRRTENIMDKYNP